MKAKDLEIQQQKVELDQIKSQFEKDLLDKELKIGQFQNLLNDKSKGDEQIQLLQQNHEQQIMSF